MFVYCVTVTKCVAEKVYNECMAICESDKSLTKTLFLGHSIISTAVQ